MYISNILDSLILYMYNSCIGYIQNGIRQTNVLMNCNEIVLYIHFHHNPVYIEVFTVGSGLKLEEFEDTKGAIRIRILKKNRQHNGQKKKYKRTNNDLQIIHIKLKIE
jgi:hypothetical protein